MRKTCPLCGQQHRTHLDYALVHGISGGAGEVQNQANAQKTLYPPVAVDVMLNESLVFRPRLMRGVPPGAKPGEGYTIKFPAEIAPDQAGGQTVDGGALPVPGDPTDLQFTVNPTFFVFGFTIGYVNMKVITSTKSSWHQGGDYGRRQERTMSAMGKFIEQTYVGTAGDGIRGYVEADGANTITLRNPEAAAYLIRENSKISVRQSAGGAVRDSLDNRKVTAYNRTTRVLTYDGADQTAVAGDPVYIIVAAAQALTSTFANGVRGQVDDGVLTQFIHGLDRTTAANFKLKSIVDDGGGTPRPLSEQIVMRIAIRINDESGKMPDSILHGPGFTLGYSAMIQPQRRWPTTGKTRQGSAVGIQNEDIVFYAPGVALTPIIGEKGQVSFDVIPREFFILTWETWFHYVAVDAQWMDEEDLLHLAPNNTGFLAAYLAYCASIENMGTFMPNANGCGRDIRDNYRLSDG